GVTRVTSRLISLSDACPAALRLAAEHQLPALLAAELVAQRQHVVVAQIKQRGRCCIAKIVVFAPGGAGHFVDDGLSPLDVGCPTRSFANSGTQASSRISFDFTGEKYCKSNGHSWVSRSSSL